MKQEKTTSAMNVKFEAKQRYLLSDEQIVVSRPTLVANGPTVVSGLTSGYACTKAACESRGGTLVADEGGGLHCYGVSEPCHDSGTWDMD